jgi:hypothetical protein
MAMGPRRLRNLNLEAQDAGKEQQVPDDLADNEIEENLQGLADVDNILARMPNRRASPIKIICKFDISFVDIYLNTMLNHIHVDCRWLILRIKVRWIRVLKA